MRRKNVCVSANVSVMLDLAHLFKGVLETVAAANESTKMLEIDMRRVASMILLAPDRQCSYLETPVYVIYAFTFKSFIISNKNKRKLKHFIPRQ